MEATAAMLVTVLLLLIVDRLRVFRAHKVADEHIASIARRRGGP